MSKIIFIGGINEGNIPLCGETVKNQILIEQLRALGNSVITIDTMRWRSNPFVLVKMFFVLLFNRRAKVIISASSAASYLISFLYYIPLKKSVYFWVIGGDIHHTIRKGRYNLTALANLKYLLVEGQNMVSELAKFGLSNVIKVPNFKPVVYYPAQKQQGQLCRFIFLSRVHPDKGIREIIEAARTLSDMGLKDRFVVDFYGSVEPSFEAEFTSLVAQNDNTNYKGFLNLREVDGYKTLEQYDAMLFPTYWNGEGFPGVVLDAYMAGVPIIASDWSMNREVVKDGLTGFIIPTHDTDALVKTMQQVVEGTVDLMQMRKNCLTEAQRFDVKSVISENLLREIGLI